MDNSKRLFFSEIDSSTARAGLLPDDYRDPAIKAVINQSAASTSNDYKALVSIFLFGGADTHNIVVPYTGNPNRALYEIARPSGVRLNISELANSQLTATANVAAPTQPWAWHPRMVNTLDRWKEGNLAIIRDVGTLKTLISKDEYFANIQSRPEQLFAHNIQQSTWQAAQPDGKRDGTGWMGRTASLLDAAFNTNSKVESGAFSVSGERSQLVAYSPKNTNIYPTASLKPGDTFGANPTLFEKSRKLSFHRDQIPKYDRNLVHNAYRDIFINSIDAQQILSDNVTSWDVGTTLGAQIEAVFTKAVSDLAAARYSYPSPINPSNLEGPFGLDQQGNINQFKNAAKLIYSQKISGTPPKGLEQRRQVIMISLGGWDHHQSLRNQHDNLLMNLDICMDALYKAVKLMGLDNNVAMFTESEFSRTFRSNGTFGVDHAWSGHSFVIGGPVKGGMYGSEPNYVLGGTKDVSNQGLFIPNYSTEQYYSSLLRWFDVPLSVMHLLLPNINSFGPIDIRFMN